MGLALRPTVLCRVCLALLLAASAVAQTPPPVSAPHELRLLFVGDVMLARGVGAKALSRGDWTFPFQKIAETLRAADLSFGNLECAVSDTGRDLHHLYSLRADPQAIDGLKFAGFRVLSVANNHVYDWDRPALLDTLRRLREAGIEPVGAGANDLEAHQPVVVNLGGTRIALLAYVGIEPREATAGPDRAGVAWLDPARVLEDIRLARPLADLVIVSLHWGVEYAPRPQPRQIRLAHAMIDAGADLIVGGHPHVVQPLEQYRGRSIAYSLGNFVFDQRDPVTHRGRMLEVTVSDKQVKEVLAVPIAINRDFQPSVAAVDQPALRTR